MNKWIPGSEYFEDGEVYSVKLRRGTVIFRVVRRVEMRDDEYDPIIHELEIIQRPPGTAGRYEWWARDNTHVEAPFLRGYEIYKVPYYDSPLWKAIEGNNENNS